MIAKPCARVLFVLGGALLLAPAAGAACLQASDGWMRATPSAMAAGYLRLRNTCAAARVIVAASSPQYAGVSVHESVRVDGVARMRALKQLEVPAGGEVVLAPGGLHLMLMPAAHAQGHGANHSGDHSGDHAGHGGHGEHGPHAAQAAGAAAAAPAPGDAVQVRLQLADGSELPVSLTVRAAGH